MAKRKTDDRETRRGLKAASRRQAKSQYVLRLCVAGATPRSAAAIQNVTALCEKHLKGRYTLDIVDVYQKPILAVDEGVIAAPTLVKKLPLPLRRLIGDMSDEERVLVGLDLKKRGRGDTGTRGRGE